LENPTAPALDVRLPAVPGAASDARRAVHAVAAGRVADGYAVALAVSEAVANVVVHAYRGRDADAEPGHVHVTVTIEGDELVVAVADEGVGMTPRMDSPGAGLGLPIIAVLADRVEIQQLSGGTRLVLGFRLAD
jgi:anti-sigma regulatory factor (Ser/Thr protein kinase)